MATHKNKAPREEVPDTKIQEEQVPVTAPENMAEGGTPDERGAEGSFEAEYLAERDRYLRLAAEYDNFRKRSQKEREGLYTDIQSETVLKFLPVYDNLVRALTQETADAAYKKGVELIMSQFCDILEKLGVAEIPAVGEVFDPLLHNAVMHVEDEAHGENTVVEEFQKGFTMCGKVIRFGTVKVAN